MMVDLHSLGCIVTVDRYPERQSPLHLTDDKLFLSFSFLFVA